MSKADGPIWKRFLIINLICALISTAVSVMLSLVSRTPVVPQVVVLIFLVSLAILMAYDYLKVYVEKKISES